jgi:tripartite ATP-independent transporter DctM subunit
LAAAWAAKWEILAPAVAIGSLVGGLATPTESAALTAAYAIATQAFAHRELGWRLLGRCLLSCTQLVGGIMLILGMTLALTNYLVDAGIPDAAIDWVQGVVPNKFVFLLVLCVFLCVAAAMMEIFAAIVVLVPLLLPLARSYGIDPVHFGIIMVVNLALGMITPPFGVNLFAACTVARISLDQIVTRLVPFVLVVVACLLVITYVPVISIGLRDLVYAK